MKYGERWYVEIRRGPGQTEAVLGHESLALGNVTWDALMWPMESFPLTEREILNELYEAVLAFITERR